MDFYELTISNIISFFIGLFFSWIFDRLKKFYKNICMKHNINTVICNNNDDICPISSVIPCYKSNDLIETEMTTKEFYIAFPNEVEIKNKSEFKSSDSLPDEIKFDKFGITSKDFYELLNSKRYEIAKNFASRTDGLYYNSIKYGVYYSDGFGRTTDSCEDPKLFVQLFKTDYFSQRVIEATFYNLQLKEKIDLNFLNDNMKGFRPSLGVSVIIVLPSDEILLTKRSKYVSYNTTGKEWIYVSVTESFTDTDYDEYCSRPDLIMCIQRGLKEELGIDYHSITNIKIYSMFYEKNFLQDGILAAVQVNKNVTYEKLTKMYAKDKLLEISEFIPVKNDAKSIKQFINKNKENLRPQTKYALENYAERCACLFK